MTKYQEIAQMLDANAINDIVIAYEKGREDAIKEGRADGARKFAEWLSNTEYVTSQGHFILPLRGYFTIDEVVSEWEKEKK